MRRRIPPHKLFELYGGSGNLWKFSQCLGLGIKNEVVTSPNGKQLPGYLNRFVYKAETETDCNTNSDSGVSDSENFKRGKNGSLGGKSISSEGNSECDSGVGSNRSNKSDSDKSDNENSSKLEDGITYEQIKAHYSKPVSTKVKRTESTFSRFSAIFKSDGKKLTDVMVEEFRLNDRFSGLSMDRIWGGFMNDIKEDIRQPAPALGSPTCQQIGRTLSRSKMKKCS
ncbi:Oidioi.mRNA.OKI2018_I69.chr2.g4410.t1.cds [Oikopleura dioica]|uniref:Oidioi.mRNA.OKI2018_I69.chr2.g4410.t1.cds n=1 Tax=Oikopleura dioica TaxID=34765 RepID=A0ABN7T1H5_OIKDI|nr:Oidioi.mRNA.OKI2018_I69.chr2.g4410.t1.cds [Oikopleura dioica]